MDERKIIKIQQARKWLYKLAIIVLIIGIIISSILLIIESGRKLDLSSFHATLTSPLVVALVFYVINTNLKHIEKGNRVIRILAWTSTISCVVWGVFTNLLLWGVVSHYQIDLIFTHPYLLDYSNLTIFEIIILISMYITSIGFWIPGIILIEETTKLVKPLKTIAIICVIYLCVSGVFLILEQARLKEGSMPYGIFGIVGTSFLATTFTAFIISTKNDRWHKKTTIIVTISVVLLALMTFALIISNNGRLESRSYCNDSIYCVVPESDY